MSAKTSRLKYVLHDVDRHGKRRSYYRRDGRKSRIRAEIGTPEFAEAYQAIHEAHPERPTRAPRYPEGTLIYFALAGRRIKIGISKDPVARMKSLKTGSPGVRLYYATPGGFELERELHGMFATDRINGEWFTFSKAIKDWIIQDEAKR